MYTLRVIYTEVAIYTEMIIYTEVVVYTQVVIYTAVVIYTEVVNAECAETQILDHFRCVLQLPFGLSVTAPRFLQCEELILYT